MVESFVMELKLILESLLFAAQKPMSAAELREVFVKIATKFKVKLVQ